MATAIPASASAGGAWQGNHYSYNRAVTNVNVTVVHNTYNTTVINNVAVNKVSYNGGAGGIAATPSTQERQFAQEKHLAPTTLQQQHTQQAAHNPGLFARANGGHPAIAATPRPAAFNAPGVVGARGAGAPQAQIQREQSHTPAQNQQPAQPQQAANQKQVAVQKAGAGSQGEKSTAKASTEEERGQASSLNHRRHSSQGQELVERVAPALVEAHLLVCLARLLITMDDERRIQSAVAAWLERNDGRHDKRYRCAGGESWPEARTERAGPHERLFIGYDPER